MWSYEQNLVRLAFFMTEVIKTSILQGFHQSFFEGCSWFKFNNLELALDMALKFYTSVVKGLKLKIRKVWGIILTFVGVTVEKLVGGLFSRRSNLFETFIKVRYTLSGKISSGKSFRR